MILSEEGINRTLRGDLSDGPVRGHTIRINGRTFATDKGKVPWKKGNHATSAFRMALESRVRDNVFPKLHNQGLGTTGIYGNEGYGDAWNNFWKYLVDNGLIQIIEIEW